MQNKTFRLFISSTFNDFTNEREVLQKEVFPELELFCEKYGYQFQAIDLRWGVSEEAQYDQKTLDICLEEVKNCKLHPNPNFLIMTGNRYGWVPLPYSIEKNEFESIYAFLGDGDKSFLLRWYILDKNQLPTSYILKERLGKFRNYDTWEMVETRLRNIFHTAIESLDFSSEEKKKYFLSATEHEVVEGIFEYMELTSHQQNLLKEDKLRIDSQYVFGFLRDIEISNNYDAHIFVDENSASVTSFKENIEGALSNNNILKIKTNLISNNTLSLTYLDEFKQFILRKLKRVIKNQIDIFSKHNRYDEELLLQENYLKTKQSIFIGREKDKKFIHNFLASDNNRPLIIYGRSGLGKSALMAKIIDGIESDVQLVYRFVGATPSSSDTKSILSSIYMQLTNNSFDEKLSLEDLSLEFYRFLIEYQYKLILIIDAVDQFYNKDSFMWLPEVLNDNIKVIITALKDPNYKEDSVYYEILSSYHTNLYELTPLEINNEAILELLKRYNRTLSMEQVNYVNTLYSKVNSPQRTIIQEYITNLISIHKHNPKLIEKVMSYIYSSQDGLSEKELLDFLSMDSIFINAIAPQTYHKNISNKIPISIWSRLQFGIKTFITQKNIDGILLMQFFHREFNDAIKELFDTKIFHKELIEYAFEKIKEQNYDFHQTRISKLYTLLVIQYATKYDADSIVNYFGQLTILEKKWLDDFLEHLMKIIKDYFQSGHIVEAKLIADSVYSNPSLLNNMKDRYTFLFTMGEIEQNQSATDKAIEYYKKSIDYVDTEIQKAYSRIQIAKTLRHGGKPAEASAMLSELLSTTLKQDSIEKADAMIQLGLCKLSEKNYKEAYKYYMQADQYIVNFTQDRKLKLYNWLGISTVVAFMGKVQEGLALLYRIKNESQQFGYQNFYMDSLNGIAKKHLMLEEFQEANEYALQALELGKKQKNMRFCYLMHGYIVESYAGMIKEKTLDQKDAIQKASVHLEKIKVYEEDNLVKEKLLRRLVQESLMKWKKQVKI